MMIWVAMVLPATASACPNCKEGLDANRLAWAFGMSVLFMMSMPFAIAATWLLAFWRTR
jgi:hypothetical protein